MILTKSGRDHFIVPSDSKGPIKVGRNERTSTCQYVPEKQDTFSRDDDKKGFKPFHDSESITATHNGSEDIIDLLYSLTPNKNKWGINSFATWSVEPIILQMSTTERSMLQRTISPNL